MDTITHHKPGTVVLVAIGVVLVAAVTGIALIGPPAATEYEPGSAEAAAQAYLQAQFDGDYDLAYEMLAPALQARCRSFQEIEGLHDTTRAEFEAVRIRADRVTIDVRLLGTQFAPGPIPVEEHEISTYITLERSDTGWRIVAAGWPLEPCDWR